MTHSTAFPNNTRRKSHFNIGMNTQMKRYSLKEAEFFEGIVTIHCNLHLVNVVLRMLSSMYMYTQYIIFLKLTTATVIVSGEQRKFRFPCLKDYLDGV